MRTKPSTRRRKAAKNQEVLLDENQLSQLIIESAIEVHRTLGGPGLLESVYRDALALEIGERGIEVEREKSVPVKYKGHPISTPLRIDLLAGNLVIVECKAVTPHNAIFKSQVLTYLRLTGLKLGLVINFGQRLVKHGIHRVVNGL